MYITAREKWILDYLLNLSEETTTSVLAKELSVSQRTIHRDLKGVEQVLNEYHLELKKTSGRGILIVGEETFRQALKSYLMDMEHTEYTPEERQHLILCSLLENREPVKLLALAHDLNVTIATISHDLDKLETRLDAFGLSLIRRRGYGVEINGSEKAKRHAMSSLILDQLNESEFLAVVRENIQKKSSQVTDTISDRLLGIVEKKKIKLVEQVVDEVYEDLPYAIADSAFIGLVVHLALAIERIMRQENINMDPDYLDALKQFKEYTFAEEIAQKLEVIFDIKIPEAEIGYICMHLNGAKLRQDKEALLDESSYSLAYKARQLIECVDEAYHQDLLSDPSLLQGLVSHLKPALYRIQENMGITNPVLSKIKEDYRDLFAVVSQAVKQVFDDLEVPEEEIGYIAMHFGAALFKYEATHQLRALVICSSGIGTSKMLSSRLKRELPEIEEFVNASVFDLKKMNLEAFDLILSTIPLFEFDETYILVEAIPTEEDINQIRKKVRGIEKTSASHYQQSAEPQRESAAILKSFKQKSHYATIIYHLLSEFSLTFIKKELDLEDVLKQACSLLHEKGMILSTEEIVQALLEREKIGGVGIPLTHMALYHTKNSSVEKPTFTMYVLEHPIQVMGMDGEPIQLHYLLLMLAPEDLSNEGLEILSYISALLIETKESLTIFQSGDHDLILKHLSTALESYYNEKTRSGNNHDLIHLKER